ncbi:ADP-ribosylation factor 1-like protein [Dactylonectria macrodidyma]|uniref:ADP-ribosylation factor 1-like protein n=1 Tax=Dactylonectria macrodidyma TaxID=307937 RepID=A0A9P9INZ4_9HYPO|nr:ADP-ribosylation factor 1-like protein [Dactylonectria macrodidyma]
MGNIFSFFRPDYCGALPPQKILLCGLDNAGKSALLLRLQRGEFVKTTPTDYYHMGLVKCRGDIRAFELCDVSGQERMRPAWKVFFKGMRGVIFVIDSTDDTRLIEAGPELWRVAKAEELHRVPILIIANKQDLASSMSASEIAHKLDLDGLADRAFYTQPTSLVTGDGLHQGMKWLLQEIQRGHA